MKHIKRRQINSGNEQKICIRCSVPLEIKKVGSSKGNCYMSNYNNRIYKCNKCFRKDVSTLVKKSRKNKTVGDAQHLHDMRCGARDRAKVNNIPFDLTTQDIRDIITDRCPILGIKFELNKQGQDWGKGKGKNNWQTSPSLDRIIPEKGYVKDNIIIVSLMANSIKNQATPNQIQKVATFYKKLYNERGITYGN